MHDVMLGFCLYVRLHMAKLYSQMIRTVCWVFYLVDCADAHHIRQYSDRLHVWLQLVSSQFKVMPKYGEPSLAGL